ncbi:hypothetical protein HHK36_000231 [Tetracentron sinense]|uniref:Uncharacterized protein n=1 Tax=Tetracentron sinense TaxID=13715 RepID=A0A834ZVJ0_TETSI|nr:hypothetical protein HHK36_000231 [Tetracentron sinense]
MIPALTSPKISNQGHSDDTPVVALPTGWFNNESRCLKNIKISANGRSVVAKVVDECGSTMGCDSDHDYYQPHVLTTSWMPPQLYGKPWVCLAVTGVGWTLSGSDA